VVAHSVKTQKGEGNVADAAESGGKADLMLLGHIDLIDHHMVRGWAVDTDRPHATVDVAVFVNGRLVGLVLADQSRDDLKDAATLGSGAHGLTYLFDPPLATDQDHDVVARFVEGGKLVGQSRVARLPASPIASVPAAAAPDVVIALPEASLDNATPTADGEGLIGFLDVCSRDRLVGWAAREGRPEEIITISVFVDGSEMAQVRCDVPREDLAEAGGFGDGAHGFNYSFDPPLPTNVLLQVSVRFALTNVPMANGEQWLSAVQTESAPGTGAPSGSGAAPPKPSLPAEPVTEYESKYFGRIEVISRDGITGWAACLDEPDASIDVIIFVNGQRVARVRCNDPRPDLDKMWARGSAPHGLRFAFASRLPDELDLRISVRFADSGEVLNSGTAELPAASGGFRLAPLLVTAPGRSGTTMLMERLGRCNEVVVANSHPFEIRMLSYYATAYNVLTSPANLQRSTHPDKLEGTGFFVGFNPFSDEGFNAAFKVQNRREEFFSGFVPSETLSAFRNIILEYYLQSKDDQDKKQARFFAEKNNNLDLIPRRFARAMFGWVREIVLLRDPRDLYCSRLAYFKHITPRTVLQEVRWACTQLRELYQEATPDMIFVKYEDIVLGNTSELRRLSDFLGFDLYPIDTSLDQKSRFVEHATSGSPASSVGRWRDQMSADEISAFDESGAEFFQMFGYESSAKAMAATTTAGAAPAQPADDADPSAGGPRQPETS
jgi:hypothetical protein